MHDIPLFPDFRPVELDDRRVIGTFFARYQPETSELTFSNLYIWRTHYHTRWCVLGDWLLVLLDAGDGRPFALPPIGPPGRTRIVRRFLDWMRAEGGIELPMIGRADARLAAELREAAAQDLDVRLEREHFDYLYRTDDLARLHGHRYDAKRHHVTQFRRSWDVVYEPLREAHVADCLRVLDVWCEWRRCDEDLSLIGDRAATREALVHFGALDLTGGVVYGEEGPEAFALGESLNDRTAVVHVEKANPHVPGLFAVINQQFARQAWPTTPYLNREQDLGEPGLRLNKLSYHPVRLVEKYRVRPAGE